MPAQHCLNTRKFAGQGAAAGGCRWYTMFATCVWPLLLPGVGCRRSPAASTGRDAAAEPWFVNVTAETGIEFVHASGHHRRHWFPEIMSGGIGLCDFNGDGLVDMYHVQGGAIETPHSAGAVNRMYLNRGGWQFEDVTQRAGVGDTGYGMGCACGDYDGDGHVDLYVTNVGPNVLYHNNGDGGFTDVGSASGTDDPGWGTSSTFLDYDADGDLDLFVVNYIRWSCDHELNCTSLGGQPDYCKPGNYNAPAPDRLFRNNGDGTFDNVSAALGMDRAFGQGLGVVAGDFNGDGAADLYVANDGTPNQLWIQQDGRFVDQALISGCAVNRHGVAEAGMGVWAVDVEDDGDLDLFMTHLRLETNTFYLNDGGLFEDATIRVGLGVPSVAYTGFGLGFADFDHDGLQDVYVANGRVMLHVPRYRDDDPYAEPNLLFAGRDGGRFEVLDPPGGTLLPGIHTSRGVAIGDLDNDGAVDLVVANRDAAPYVLRNVAAKRGQWIGLRLLNRHGSDAIGAVAAIVSGGRTRVRMVQPGCGYCSSMDPRIHCGLGGERSASSIAVRWPGGDRQEFGPLPAGRWHVLRQAP